MGLAHRIVIGPSSTYSTVADLYVRREILCTNPVNLAYAEVVEIFVEDGMRMGLIEIGGAAKKVALDLLTDAECGDEGKLLALLRRRRAMRFSPPCDHIC